jgi:tetratricopeptide (TPR) repeat protein
MGEVYLARDPRLGRRVALKVLSPELATQAEFRDRFLREARSVSSLNHPNINTIHDIGQAEGLDYIALEYVEGPNLEQILRSGEPLSLARFLDLAIPLAEGLHHAHGHGLVHRDLKPANVVVSSAGAPKILDFGLAKAVLPDAAADWSEAPTRHRLTQAGVVVGTIAYMSPEQALGKEVDARSDIFSFGCLLYEMAASRPAFEGANAMQVLDGLLHRDPVPLREIRSDLPGELTQIVDRAIRKGPDARYPHMGALVSDLRAVPREGREREKTWGLARLGWRRLAAAAVLIGVLALGALILKTSGSGPAGGRPHSVAVFYFENLSDPGDSDNVARMLTSLLTTELSGAEGLEVVSRQRLHDVAEQMGEVDGAVSHRVATEVARRAGVGTMILGRVARVGDRIVATSELVDVTSGRSLASQKAEGTDEGDVFGLAEALGDQVRGYVRQSSLVASREASDGPRDGWTRSVDAYRAYVRGESLVQAGRFEQSIDEYQESIRLDPGFAMAHFRLSMAARWISDGVLAREAAARADALVDRLPEDLADVVRANHFYHQGSYSLAIPLLEAALERDRALKEGLYLLSQIYLHSTRDGNTERAVALMEELVELDPDFHLVYDRLALAQALLGRPELARANLARWTEVRPDKVQALQSVFATFEGQPEEALAFGQAFSWIEGPLFQAAAAMLASRWDVAERLVAFDPDEWRADHLRAWGLRNRGILHAYRGDFEQAERYLREAARVGAGERAVLHEGTTGGVRASALHALAELFEARGRVAEARRTAEEALVLQPESARSLYVAGRYALAEYDATAAAGYMNRLERLAASSRGGIANLYLAGLEAEMAMANGNPADARDRIADFVEPGTLMADWASHCASSGSMFRDTLARAHLALGDRADAMEVLDGLLVSGVERLEHPALYVVALRRLGSLRLDNGDPSGERLLERYRELWGTTSVPAPPN